MRCIMYSLHDTTQCIQVYTLVSTLVVVALSNLVEQLLFNSIYKYMDFLQGLVYRYLFKHLALKVTDGEIENCLLKISFKATENVSHLITRDGSHQGRG